MGLPVIDIVFKQLAVSAIQRSQRSVAAIIIQDDTSATAGYDIYKYEKDLPTAGYTAENLAAIKRCFLVAVNKIIVVHVPTTGKLADALNILEGLVYTYVCSLIPDSQQELANYLISKNANSKGKKYIGVVAAATTADSKYIINVKNAQVHDIATKAWIAMVNYLPRLTSLLANLPMNRSATYYVLGDIDGVDQTFITTENDVDSWIDKGFFVLIQDEDVIRVGRGVNSLTTLTSTDSADMKKIIIVESMNIILEDIYNTFKNDYVGHYKNYPDNQNLFISAINTYFRELAKEEILDPDYDNHAEIDVEAQRNAWLSTGKTAAADWSDEKVKNMAYKSYIYLAGDIKILDAIEDLKFNITME